ncbi:MAG: GGDEF domain-containing protein [Defluviitaleaceae bacterium]|nr:GGDEF domain-containing protein [Defluviitaleaceae bacterium]
MHLENISSNVIDKIFNEISVFVIAFGAEGEVLFHNNAAEEVCGKHIMELKFGDIFFQEHRMLGDDDIKLKYEYWIGGRCYLVVDFYSEYKEGISARFITGHDITDAKNYVLSYNNRSMVDPMTGIFNRQVGIDFLNEMINQFKLDDDPFSVSFIDLDKLKLINDNFGHGKGDEYIFTVCDTIKSSIRKTDIFSRIGGDEFLIIFPQCSESVATKIMENVAAKLSVVNKSLPEGIMYRISYGILEVNTSVQLDTEHVLSAADSKMYQMKALNNEKDKLSEVTE